jgi:hypothetical protein
MSASPIAVAYTSVRSRKIATEREGRWSAAIVAASRASSASRASGESGAGSARAATASDVATSEVRIHRVSPRTKVWGAAVGDCIGQRPYSSSAVRRLRFS